MLTEVPKVPKIGKAKDMEDAATLMQTLVDKIRSGEVRGFLAATAGQSSDESDFCYWSEGDLSRPEKVWMIEKLKQWMLDDPPVRASSDGKNDE